jgi:pimeloyl-ACP methyl ester carboxylesterase
VEQYKTEIVIGNYKVEVLDNGKSGDLILIFNHNSGAAISGLGLFNENALSEYRLVSVSLLGHGTSARSTNIDIDYSISGIGNFILDVVNYYQPNKYWLIGQSVSGHAIIEAHNLFERCSGIILVCAPPISLESLEKAFIPSAVVPLLFQEELSDIELKDISSAFTIFEKNIPLIAKGFTQCDPLFRSGLGKSIKDGRLLDEKKCLESLKCPIIFIRADEDSFIDSGYYDSIDTSIGPSIEIEDVFSSGHAALIDNPHECAEIIAGFIGRHK